MAQVYGEPLSKDADAFTARRRTGIGGSDAGAILGVGYGSAMSVWEDKRGLAPPREAVIERMVWGSRLEAAVRDGYAEDYGARVVRVPFRRNRKHSFVVGHADGQVTHVKGKAVGTPGKGLEVKVTSRMGDQWGEPGSADVPPGHYAQVQHYMMLTGWSVMDVAALLGGREMHVFTVPADKEFQEALLEEEHALWELVKSGEPPDPDGSASAREVLNRLYPREVDDSIVATPEMQEAAQGYLDADIRVKAAQADKDLAQNLMLAFIGERTRLDGGGFSATWKEAAGRISWKDVAARYRAVIERVGARGSSATDFAAIEEQARSKPSRRFGFTTKGDK